MIIRKCDLCGRDIREGELYYRIRVTGYTQSSSGFNVISREVHEKDLCVECYNDKVVAPLDLKKKKVKEVLDEKT